MDHLGYNSKMQKALENNYNFNFLGCNMDCIVVNLVWKESLIQKSAYRFCSLPPQQAAAVRRL